MRLPVSARPFNVVSSPRWSVTAPFTISPRVFLGRRTSFMPDDSVERRTRPSMLAGVAWKSSPAAMGRAARVVSDQGLDRRRHRDLHSLGSRRRHIDSRGTVVAEEIGVGHPRHVARRDLLQPVAMQEHDPPVTHRRPLAQADGHPLGVAKRELPLLELVLAGARHLFGRGRRRCRILRRPRSSRLARLRHRHPAADRR